MDATEEHVTRIEHDGFCFYFHCTAGDVNHTDNAYDSLSAALDAAEQHAAHAVTQTADDWSWLGTLDSGRSDISELASDFPAAMGLPADDC